MWGGKPVSLAIVVFDEVFVNNFIIICMIIYIFIEKN